MRPDTFQCECGVTEPQNKRGKERTRCTECQKKRKKQYLQNYYHRNKQAAPVAAE